YADYGDPEQLHAELRRSLSNMHNANLQRVDRMSMAHGVEARVPFLDRAVIAEAMTIHPRLKQYAPGSDELVEKWVLRAAAAGLLPDEVVWRTKAQFDEGSGTSTFLPSAAAAANLDEAQWYADLLDKRFARPDQVDAVTGRWADGRV
ncbi:MAG: hypothetical protein J2P14_10445, partial [Acidothermales bacterium]|nr:hypothetical protein [Acidothermales bacterium]